MAVIGLVTIALTAIPVSSAAELLPRAEQVASPREAPALAQMLALAMANSEARGDLLPQLDRMLASTAGPTPLRGLVQFLRAGALLDANRGREASPAIEESIRLLPSYTAPLLLAMSIEAYNDRPALGADYLLRAAALAPEDVLNVDDYELSNLVTRLDERDEMRRLNRIAGRLFEIGWHGNDASLRSSLARRLIRERLLAGDYQGARSLLPNLLLPGDAREMLLGNEYSALWPDLEVWTGPRQTRQWSSYLNEARARWQASRDPVFAEPYVRALVTAGHNRTLVDEMLPILMARLDARGDYRLIWAAASVAKALARLGRWDEADLLYAHTMEVWPLGSDANAINLAANRALLHLYRGDAAVALREIDAVIAEIPRWGGAVSPGPLAAIHFVRACALQQMGRRAEAVSSVALAAANGSPETLVDLYLCLDQPDAARNALIEALRRDSSRAFAIDLVQIDDRPPLPSSFGRGMRAKWDALRADPRLREAVARYGRILPYSLESGAPAEAASR
jgi:tetratricopeptide (TPR) repeat protein